MSGPREGTTLERHYPRTVESLAAIVADTAAFFAEHGIDPAHRYAVDLALEELFVNMVRYNRGPGLPIRIELRPAGSGLRARLTDAGAEPFDPTAIPAPDIEAPLASRQGRGLGVHLVRHMVEELRYEHRDGDSHVSFSKGAG